jgi:hypothetical protein
VHIAQQIFPPQRGASPVDEGAVQGQPTHFHFRAPLAAWGSVPHPGVPVCFLYSPRGGPTIPNNQTLALNWLEGANYS